MYFPCSAISNYFSSSTLPLSWRKKAYKINIYGIQSEKTMAKAFAFGYDVVAYVRVNHINRNIKGSY